MLEPLAQDLRYALRTFRRSPGFTAVIVISIALGIGANTAIFTFINMLTLRRLPVREPSQLVEFLKLYSGDPRMNFFSPDEYRYIRDHNDVFTDVIATSPSRASVRPENGAAETLEVESVTANYFPALDLRPAIGRFIGPQDSTPVAVVSWSYWKDRFNLDPSILGRRIDVGSTPATIVGVAPRSFTGLRLWLPSQLWLSGAEGGAIIARLRRGVSGKQAEAQATVLYHRVQELKHDPLSGRIALQLESGSGGIALPVLRDRFAKPLLALMTIVLLLLPLACANVAGILLSRSASREREMAVRVSLGAGRGRLMRQVLTESVLLSSVAALAGILLAWLSAAVLVRVITSGRPVPGLPRNLQFAIQPDTNILLFTTAIAILTGVLFGLAPALRATATMPAGSLTASGRSGETRRGRRFAAALVVAQSALTVVLLAAAGLFLQHLSHLRNNVGFQRDRVLLATVDPARRGLNRRQLTVLYRDLLDRLEAIPGVRSATLCGPTPVSGAGASRFVSVEGHTENSAERRYVSLAWVAPKYFQTLGTPLLAGRDFTFQDQNISRVAIVNQAMVRHYFANQNPIGKHIRIDRDPRTGGWYGEDQPYEIVGVVADAKYYDPGEPPTRTIFFNAFQEDRIQSNFVLRTAVPPSNVIPALNRTLSELLKGIPVERVTTLSDQIDAALVPERLTALLSGTFGALGAILAAVGLYGLLAYTVARRTNEIGIRMALGATSASVSRMILFAALKMALGGLALGIPAALAARALAARLIPGLAPGAPLPIAAGAAALIAIALVAAYFPVRRAARINPTEALRYD